SEYRSGCRWRASRQRRSPSSTAPPPALGPGGEKARRSLNRLLYAFGGHPFVAEDFRLGVRLDIGVMRVDVFAVKQPRHALGQAFGAIADCGDVTRYGAVRQCRGVRKTMHPIQTRAATRRLFL